MYSVYHDQDKYLGTKQKYISLPGLFFVVAIHGVLFYFLWQQRLMPTSDQMVTLFADFITAPAPESSRQLKLESPPTKHQSIQKPPPKPKAPKLATNNPVLPDDEAISPTLESEPEQKPIEELEPEPKMASQLNQMQTEPVTLTSELAVSCPELNAPAYPPISRRMGEEGNLVLRVELDENGRVDHAEILNSSGYSRLDDAAMTAVKSWKCNPPIQNGQPARAVALQPFNFVLQGN